MSDHPPIQIVDEDDNPIGGADMLQAYDNGQIHRIVFSWIRDEAGRVLLQKRSAMVVTFPSCWDVSAAGAVDEGETYEQAARREVEEELGITVDDLQEVARFYHEIDVDRWHLKRFNRVYTATASSNTVFSPDPEEVSEAQWFTLDEVHQLIKEHPDSVALGLIDSLSSL